MRESITVNLNLKGSRVKAVISRADQMLGVEITASGPRPLEQDEMNEIFDYLKLEGFLDEAAAKLGMQKIE